MTWGGVWQLARRDLAASRGRALISAAGIGLGVWVLTLVVALGLGARDLVLKEVVRELPVDMVEVIPKTLDLGLFKMDAGSLFGAKPLGPQTVEALRKLPGVAAVYPKAEVPLPLGAQGGARFFGRRLYTDLFMTGIPRELVAAESPEAFEDNPNWIPVLISDQLIELYNASVAGAIGAPKLTSQSLTGFEFEIVVGRSLMLGSRGARSAGTERAHISGVSRYAMRLGVTVPMETAQRLLDKYGEPGATLRTPSILLRADAPADVPKVVQAVEAMGYTVDQTADRTRHLMGAATALAGGVGVLVLMLAALNIAHSFVAMLSERRRELAILRAVGATRSHMLALVLLQAAALGLGGGLAGLAIARGMALGLDALSGSLLPDFPFKPASFFVFPPWLCLGAVAAAMGAALLGALGPAWRAARMSIARALAD